MDKIKVKKLREGAVLPTYGTAFSAGADLYACLQEDVTILPGETKKIPTGLAMEIPTGCAGLIYARSSLHRSVFASGERPISRDMKALRQLQCWNGW